MFENRLLRGIFGPKRVEVTADEGTCMLRIFSKYRQIRNQHETGRKLCWFLAWFIL
jgi:hypothetical protein